MGVISRATRMLSGLCIVGWKVSTNFASSAGRLMTLVFILPSAFGEFLCPFPFHLS